MSETLAPPPESFTSDLPGGPMNVHESFAASTQNANGENGVSYFDNEGHHQSIALGDNEQLTMGPYGENGEPREPYIKQIDAEGNENFTSFDDYLSSRNEGLDSSETEINHEVENAFTENAATKIFEGTTMRITNKHRERTHREEVQHNPATDEYEQVTVEIDTAKEFVDGYTEKAEKTKHASETGSFVADYTEKLSATGVTEATARRGEEVIIGAAERTRALVRNGEVAKETADFFWANLGNIKQGLSLEYNGLVGKDKKVDAESVDQQNYKSAVEAMLEEKFKGKYQEQKSGDFIHINQELVTENGQEVTDRLYISLKEDGRPAEAISAWVDALEELGLSNDVYFKLPQSVKARYEGIVMYGTDAMDIETRQKIIDTFQAKCDPELLDEEQMPTALEVAPGIFRAPEPTKLNELLRYTTRDGQNDHDTVSYNETVAAMQELSFRIAASELQGQAELTPKQLATAAEPKFQELLLLSGINPEDMTENFEKSDQEKTMDVGSLAIDQVAAVETIVEEEQEPGQYEKFTDEQLEQIRNNVVDSVAEGVRRFDEDEIYRASNNLMFIKREYESRHPDMRPENQRGLIEGNEKGWWPTLPDEQVVAQLVAKLSHDEAAAHIVLACRNNLGSKFSNAESLEEKIQISEVQSLLTAIAKDLILEDTTVEEYRKAIPKIENKYSTKTNEELGQLVERFKDSIKEKELLGNDTSDLKRNLAKIGAVITTRQAP